MTVAVCKGYPDILSSLIGAGLGPLLGGEDSFLLQAAAHGQSECLKVGSLFLISNYVTQRGVTVSYCKQEDIGMRMFHGVVTVSC